MTKKKCFWRDLPKRAVCKVDLEMVVVLVGGRGGGVSRYHGVVGWGLILQVGLGAGLRWDQI